VKKKSPIDLYADFVDHPRFGQRPRETGFNPTATFASEPGKPRVHLHWHSSQDNRIPNTAIAADYTKQIFTVVGVTHYFDEVRTCQQCSRRFIFFAEEQKHWYEELGFSLDADCRRCVPCRKNEQGIAKNRQRYEELFHVAKRTVGQTLEMAECCLDLIEGSHFSRRQTERVRMLLNEATRASGSAQPLHLEQLLTRVLALEATFAALQQRKTTR
jgi:hypothetical protein